MRMVVKSFLFLLSVSALASTAHAVSDIELMKQGIWQDPKTGLYWDRCSAGQQWNGIGCTGDPVKLDWEQAKEYVETLNKQKKGGFSNWRVPSIYELTTIRICTDGFRGNSWEVYKTNIPVPSNGKMAIPTSCKEGKIAIDTMIFVNNKIDDTYYQSSDFARIDESFRLIYGISFDVGYLSTPVITTNPNGGLYLRAVRSD